MKKITLIVALALSICLIFAGCAEKPYDTNACIEALKANGFVVTESPATEDELALANAKINMEIGMFNVKATVETVSYTVLTKEDDAASICKVYEFATKEQANMYGGHFMNNRTQDGEWKVAIEDKTVITTNASSVQQILKLIFK